jgi:hypothetical protein
MSEPLLSIRNQHAPTCGDPPIVQDGQRVSPSTEPRLR